ncbi:hypothetical protein [Paenibacillus sp. Aloe-11]|uniref:hypothetical protein n=1 Tax=Paenibacillus sp. Aloe-11 TaxID=1050222 RepID=UPI0018DEDE07|nr:hypothetical protein [Paenibacillus sp. Aloe-11]
MMTLQAIIADKNHKLIPTVKELYTSSFPVKERIPFNLLIKLSESGKSDLLLFTDNHTFVGFAYRELLKFTMGRTLFWFIGPKIIDD